MANHEGRRGSGSRDDRPAAPAAHDERAREPNRRPSMGLRRENGGIVSHPTASEQADFEPEDIDRGRAAARPQRPASFPHRLSSTFLTLRGRLVLLACFATVPAILFIFFIAIRERESTLQRLQVEARHLGNLASREHVHQLEGAKNLLHRLREILACGEGAAPVLPRSDYLPVLLVGYPQFANIGLLGSDGRLLCSAVPAPDQLDMRDNPAFGRALVSSEVEVGTYVIGPIVRRPVLHLAYAIRNAEGAPCAVAFVAIDLRWLHQLARQANLPPDYSLLITDRDGRILAHSDAATAAAAGEAVPVAGLVDILRREGGGVLTVGVPPVSRLFVATPMEGIPGVFVVAGLPYDRVQSDVNRVFYRTLLGLVLLTLFTIMSAVFAADVSVLRVLRALSRTARRFGSGELTVRAVLPRSHGELQELAVSFNVMADTLAARHREAIQAQTQLRALSQRLQVARDAEAGRIARELHDELGQVLTSLRIDLASLQRSCPTPEASAMVAEMGERIDGAIDFVRRIASEMRPAVLDRLGLAAALEWLVRGFETKTGLAVALEVQDTEEPIDGLVSTTLFRIAQEALTNAARHADATEVGLALSRTEDALVLAVRDNGRGIDRAAAEGSQSLGILGMKERARLIGGSCSVRGRAGRGTTITVRVPLQPPDPESIATGV